MHAIFYYTIQWRIVKLTKSNKNFVFRFRKTHCVHTLTHTFFYSPFQQFFLTVHRVQLRFETSQYQFHYTILLYVLKIKYRNYMLNDVEFVHSLLNSSTLLLSMVKVFAHKKFKSLRKCMQRLSCAYTAKPLYQIHITIYVMRCDTRSRHM